MTRYSKLFAAIQSLESRHKRTDLGGYFYNHR